MVRTVFVAGCEFLAFILLGASWIATIEADDPNFVGIPERSDAELGAVLLAVSVLPSVAGVVIARARIYAVVVGALYILLALYRLMRLVAIFSGPLV